MLATLAHVLRLLAILTVLVGGVAIHDVAMAEGTSGATQGIPIHHLAVSGEPAHGHCTGFCEQSSPCCLLGHCLLGIMLPDDNGSASPRGLELSSARISSLLTGRLAAAPYRPPAAA